MASGAARTGTGRRVHARDPARALVLAVILFGHAVLIHFMAQHISVPRITAEGGYSSVPIHLMQIVEPQPASPRRNRQEEHAVVSLTPPDHPGETVEVPESAGTTTPALPPVVEAAGLRKDWTGSAAEADQQIARSRHNGFGEGPRDDLPSARKPLGVFERGPPHRAGDIELFEDGVERRWVNSRCYRDFGGPPDPLARRNPGLNPLRCSAGPREVDGDLFDHLKPGYLKRK
jgi:hypothetical protein